LKPLEQVHRLQIFKKTPRFYHPTTIKFVSEKFIYKIVYHICETQEPQPGQQQPQDKFLGSEKHSIKILTSEMTKEITCLHDLMHVSHAQQYRQL
jgi:hypothetical protein